MKKPFYLWLATLLACPLVLGQEFTSEDINGPASEGSTTIDGDTITIVGGGTDIWGTADMFHFHYTTFDGDEDFDVVVQVESLEGTHHWAKAELMARNSGIEFAEPGDPHISLMATRTGGQNAVEPQWRQTRDGGSGRAPAIAISPVPYPDVHFRLTKMGSVIGTYFSEDGASWQLMYRADTSVPGSPVEASGGTWNGEDFGASDTTVHVGLAVTSHDNNPDVVATAVFKGFRFLEPSPPVVLTQPSGVTVTAGEQAEFTVAFSGDASPIPTVQWTKNGEDIEGATGTTLTIERADIDDNGAQIAARISNSAGSVTSDGATLTVNPDTVPPTLTGAHGSETFDKVFVMFSEPLDPASAETAANYSLSNGISVDSASLAGAPGTANDNTVILETGEQPTGTVLTLTVNNVNDAAGDNPVADGTTFEFTTHIWVPGAVLNKVWLSTNTRIPGFEVWARPSESFARLRGLAEFPDSPDIVTLEPAWEFPPDGSNNWRDRYANQISGYFIPPETDDYVFFTNSDDPSALYLSPDADPANKLLIAQQVNWANPRLWQTGDENQKAHKRSDFFDSVYDLDQDFAEDIWEDFTSNYGISLEAGQRYYMESLSAEGTGGDNHAVTFITEDEAVDDPDYPPNGTPPALTGDVIGVFLNPNAASVTITQNPMNQSFVEGNRAELSVTAEATSAYGTSVAYQWESAMPGSDDWMEIPGATGSSYTSDILANEDSGIRYRVRVGAAAIALYSLNSSEAQVTVTPDTIPPTLVPSMSAVTDNYIVLAFSERMDRESTELPANYEVTGTTVTTAELMGSNESIVFLTLGGAPAEDFIVSVSNVNDLFGNAIEPDSTLTGLTDVLAYWDFDPEGNVAHAQPATLLGGATYTEDGEGRSGNAGDRALDLGARANGAWMRVEPTDFLNAAPASLNQISISFWQKWNTGLGAQSSFWGFSPSSNDRGFQAHTPWNAAGAVYFDTDGCCNTGTQRITSANYDVLSEDVDYGEWNHFVFIKDGDFKEIWINGELFHEGENTGPLPNDFSRLAIGSDHNGGNSHGGLLDEFAIFATPLIEDEIVMLADGMKPDEIRDVIPVRPASPITATLDDNGMVVIEYSGTLHASESVAGPFEPVAGATSPYSVTPDRGQMFYIAR